jgi:hypothetical protein
MALMADAFSFIILPGKLLFFHSLAIHSPAFIPVRPLNFYI